MNTWRFVAGGIRLKKKRNRYIYISSLYRLLREKEKIRKNEKKKRIGAKKN